MTVWGVQLHHHSKVIGFIKGPPLPTPGPATLPSRWVVRGEVKGQGAPHAGTPKTPPLMDHGHIRRLPFLGGRRSAAPPIRSSLGHGRSARSRNRNNSMSGIDLQGAACHVPIQAARRYGFTDSWRQRDPGLGGTRARHSLTRRVVTIVLT